MPDNLLVLGDNARVLRANAKAWAERFRCVYLDPPFNTGRRFAEYHDAKAPAEWAETMKKTAELVLPLVAGDGAIVAEIDDTELGSLLTVLDGVLGRENRVAIVTVVRSAATGHKAINRGPVNVTDYLLLYAKRKADVRLRPMSRVRTSYDTAYRTYLDNPHDDPSRWTFRPLARVVAERLGHPGMPAAKRALGAEAFEREVERFALAHLRHVVRFAQPRYEAIGKAARELVDASRAAPDRVFRLERGAHKDFLVRGGNRILWLADKAREVDGQVRLMEPLTNVWDDLGFQGIAREGGVLFSRNKKPERLMHRILSMTTEPGDWVLDPFAGTGTTAATAHKMGRRWIAIERERELFARAQARLGRVVAGEDATGVTRACGWSGGGAFDVVRRS